jgi:hypothetical protein
LKDCIKKIAEANKMCAELGIKKTFSQLPENDGVIRCLVTEHNRKRDDTNPYKIELKSFIVEWRIIYKDYMVI